MIKVMEVNDAQKSCKVIPGVRPLGEIFGVIDYAQPKLLGGVRERKGKRIVRGRRVSGVGRRKKVIRSVRGRGGRRGMDTRVKMRRPGQYAPDTYEANLVWVDTTASRTGTGSFDAINWYYRTSAYDPDPSVLTGAIPGFVELANMYGYYRVISMDLLLDIGTYEVNQCAVVIWPSNVSNNVNSLTKTDLIEVSGNPFARTHMLGNNNARPTRIRTKLSPRKFLGNTYYTDEIYAANTSSNPSSMLYMNIGVYRNSGNFSYETPIVAKVIYKVRFYGRRQLFSISGTQFVMKPPDDDNDDTKVEEILDDDSLKQLDGDVVRDKLIGVLSSLIGE